MGALTPTKRPPWRVVPVLGTRLPRMIPIAMAKMIQTTRKRSKIERAFRGGRSFGGPSSVWFAIAGQYVDGLHCL